MIATNHGMHHVTFNKLLAAPQQFTFEDAFHIAAPFETAAKSTLDFTCNQCEEDQKGNENQLISVKNGLRKKLAKK